MTQSNPTLELTQKLIQAASVTPDDAGCQLLLASHLKALGFSIEALRFGEVDNLWARRSAAQPLLVFAGHTDVVPTGPLAQWTSPPFTPTIRDGFLYGRGAADMKSSLAAMVVACENFIRQFPKHQGSIAFLITSDEEGPAINGTRKVMEYLQTRGEKLTWCIVGEPSSEQTLGDTVKIGRRGSLNGHLKIYGTQGHIAYPHLAENPIHRSLTALSLLCNSHWDDGLENFPATSLQISNIHSGTGATNVIPGDLEVLFNFRFSPAVTAEQLQQKVTAILNQQQLHYDLTWKLSGGPFLTASGKLLDAASAAIQEITGLTPQLSTGGGTSDGRFIAPTGCEVIELGPCNASIHQIDEHVRVDDLTRLAKIYEHILVKLLAPLSS